MPRASSRLRQVLRRLPSPRDEQALALARSLKGLVKGTPVVTPKTQPPATARQDSPRQWVREVAELESAGPPVEPEGTDPVERAAVRSGWLLADAFERLTTAGAERVFGHELQAWSDYATETVPDLAPWGRPGRMKPYESDISKQRFRRMLDFVTPGERVFDVGFGYGYLAGLLLREGKLAAYHGIDIVEANLAAFHQMREANGLASAEIDVRLGDIYELTREQVEATGAGLLICCEVLEHVPDAERALRTLADALPEGAELLFSVPLFGRLEQVWGHLSVFDTARLKAMLAKAGLVAHHVEPLANTWTIVLASKSAAGSARVREAGTRPAVNASRPLSGRSDFVEVPVEDFEVARVVRGAECELEPAVRGMLACTVRTPETGRPNEGPQASMTFPVRGVEALRLMLRFTGFDDVRKVRVRALRETEVVAEWVWLPKSRQLAGSNVRRFAFRPGESGSAFTATAVGKAASADSVQLAVTVRPGKTATFDLRAAYLPVR